MLTYSIAIRTLGTAGEKFREELISIAKQTIQPDRVLVYIADGYSRPDFTIGREEYHWTKKGMMAQRLLPYDDIDTDCILMLDDDVRLAPDSVERLLNAMEMHNADCVGADIFKNQDMSIAMKVYAAVTNLVFPHYSNKWAFKIHCNGSFSYNNNPKSSFYLSQSCGGPVMMWRKSSYKQLCMEDELWLDSMAFAYGDDALESYKVYRNGYKLGILYNSGIENLDAGTASTALRRGTQRIYVRTKASFCIWWRSCFAPSDMTALDKIIASLCFAFKTLWLLFVMCGASVVLRDASVVTGYIKGLKDGWRYVHTDKCFVELPNYIIK